MSILAELSKLKRSQSLRWAQRFIKSIYYDPDTVILHQKNFDVLVVDGCHFRMTSQVDSVQRVKGNPWFEGVQPTDVVVDIGANIGAVTIPLAKTARLVYAIEPLYHVELYENVTLNRLENVIILPLGIGKAGVCRIQFAGRERECQIIPFAQLKEKIGQQINFLKLDGEGCEWDMAPEDLEGVREVRIEFHVRRQHRKRDSKALDNWLAWFSREGYTVDLSREYIGLNVNPFYSDMVLARASKEV